MRTDIVAGLCLQGVACLAPLPGAALLPLFGTGSGAEHPHAEAQLAGAPAHLLARSAPIAAQFHICSVEQPTQCVHCADSNSLFVCRAELLLHNQHKGQCAVAAAAAAAAEATAVLALQVEAFLQTPADHSTLHSTLRDFYLLRIYVLPKHGDNFSTVF